MADVWQSVPGVDFGYVMSIRTKRLFVEIWVALLEEDVKEEGMLLTGVSCC